MTSTRIAKTNMACAAIWIGLFFPLFAAATSPPQPPPITTERAIELSTAVLVLKGVRFHWIAFSKAGEPPGPRVVNGPSDGELGHYGSVILEATVTKRLYCSKPCDESDRIYVRFEGATTEVLPRLPGLLKESQIFFLRELTPAIERSYPKDIPKGWHMGTVNSRTFHVPASSEAMVLNVVSRVKASK